MLQPDSLQTRRGQPARLPAFDVGLDDVGREEGERQDTAVTSARWNAVVVSQPTRFARLLFG